MIREGLTTAIKESDELFQQHLKKSNDDRILEQYELYRNKLVKDIKTIKSLYYKNKIENNTGIKNLYNTLREAIRYEQAG